MSRARVSLEPGFVLHQRAYRETSRLLEIFTREHGRVGLVARGVSGTRGGGRSAILQPLQPLLLSWIEAGELGTLTGAESGGEALRLNGENLICAWYLNELLMRCLPRHIQHPDLYAFYAAALAALAEGERAAAPILREFEMELLVELGYGEVQAGDLDPAQRYDYHDGAPVRADDGAWRGDQLCAIANREWTRPDVLGDARRLMRSRLAPLIGKRPLETPRLLQSLRRMRGGSQTANED
ncbi:MAG: DNA repair protein RecO [Gammaproteobacteria bacterium]|nr:DNA repair protein RecO [Gammaproteobacteria bacterium]